MNLAATMTLNASGFTNPLAGVRKDLGAAIGNLKSLALTVTGVGAAFGAFKSSEAIVKSFFAAFEKGHELEKMSRVTGQSIRDLVALDRAFKNAGMAPDGLQRQLVMLQRSLGGVNENGEPTRAIFEQLGLSVERLQKMGAPAQIELIGQKLRALPNAAQRTAAAMAIFGRSGAEMLNLLSDPKALREAIASTKELGGIYERSAKSFGEIIKAYNAIKGKAAGFFAGVAEGVAPLLQSLLTTLKKIDLVSIGQSVGQYLKAATAAVQNGKLGEFMGLSLEVGFGKAVNFFVGAMRAAITSIGSMVQVTVENFGVITDVLVAAAATFGSALLKALDTPLSYVQATFEKLFDGSLMDGANRAQHIAEYRAMGKNGGRAQSDPAEFAKAIAAEMPGVLKDLDADPTADTVAQRAKKIRDSGGVRYGFGGEADTAGQIQAQARDALNESSKRLPKVLAAMADAFKTGLAAFKVEDITGIAASSKKLSDLIASLAKGAAGEGKTGKPEGAGDGLLGVKARSIEGDRLAKIGLFIGGSGGPALDYARRTAVGVERLHALIRSSQIAVRPGIQAGYV